MYILNVEVVWLSITILFRMYACLCRSWSPVHSNVGVSLMFVTSCSDQVLDKGVNEMHFSSWSKWSNLFKLLYWNTFKIFFHFISVFHHFVPHCSLSKRSTTKFSIRHIWGNNSIAGITVIFVYRTLISPLHYLLQQNETIARYLTIGIFLCFFKQIISENFIFETTYKYYLFAFDIDIWPHYSDLYLNVVECVGVL